MGASHIGKHSASINKLAFLCGVFVFPLFVSSNAAFLDFKSESKGLHSRHLVYTPFSGEKYLDSYFSNSELESVILDLSFRCKRIVNVFSYGASTSGLKLWAIEVSSSPGVQDGKPYVRYSGNIHGDEPSARQLLLAFVHWLCVNHETHALAGLLLQSVHLLILPSLNPDGFALHSRGNQRRRDLNRNFPDPILHKDWHLLTPTLEKETQAIMNLSHSYQFVSAVDFHEGALVANYPWDGYKDGSHAIRRVPNPSPDDTLFQHLATAYSRRHKTMSLSREFNNGITNGAAWYPVYGGMQDWSYVACGTAELTVELNDNKWPPPSDLPRLWDENLEAMLEWPLISALGGLRGVVRSAKSSTPLYAFITVMGIPLNVSSNPTTGHYYRPLAPGNYSAVAIAHNHIPITGDFTVPANLSGVMLDFYLAEVGTLDIGKVVMAYGQQDFNISHYELRRGSSRHVAQHHQQEYSQQDVNHSKALGASRHHSSSHINRGLGRRGHKPSVHHHHVAGHMGAVVSPSQILKASHGS